MSEDKKINITSYNQQGGITAYQVKLEPNDRKLDERSRYQLEQALKKNSYSSILVTSVWGDQEAFRFASQIKNYLDLKGYKVSGVDQVTYAQPVQGQIIKESNENGILEIIVGGRL